MPPIIATNSSIDDTTLDLARHIEITPDTTIHPLEDSHTRTMLMFGILIFVLSIFLCLIIYMLVRHLKKRKGGGGSDIVIINMNDQAPKRCQKIFGGAAVQSPGSRTASNSLDEGGEFFYDEDDRSDLYDHDQQQGQRMKKRPSGHNKPSSKKRRQTPPKKKKSAPMKNHKKQVERYMKMTARLGQPKASTATAPNEDSSTKSPESKSPEASSGQKKKTALFFVQIFNERLKTLTITIITMLILNAQFIFSVFNHNTAWSSFYTNALKLLPHQKWPASKKALCLISSVAGLGAASYLIVRYYFDKRKKKNDLFVEEEEENITGADENQCCISELVRKEILESMGQQHPYTKAKKDETDATLHNFNSRSYSRLSCSSGGDTLKLEDGDMDSSSSNTKIPESRSTLDSRISDCSVNTFSNRNNHRFKKVIVKSRTDDHVVISSQENGKINGFSHQEYQNSLMETLNALYGTNKLINDKEAKHLICILQQKNEETILKVLTTICNLAAFTANQDLFRLNGALPLLVELLDDCQLDSSVRLMLTQCLGNMAVNTKNNPYLQRAVAKIVESYSSPECSELQKIISIQTLTNLSVEILPRYVKDFAASIRTTLDRLMTSSGPNLACLKFLINLSCCTTLASKILFSEAPYDFADILNTDSSEDVIIRSLTLLSHLFNTKETLNLSSGYDFEKNHHRSSSESQEYNNEQGTICSILFDDHILRSEIRERLEKLKEKYSKKSNEEISQKIDRLLKTKNVD